MWRSNMSHISASSAEQSNSLAEITTAIRQLDEITQQNAAMVEQAVSQAIGLAGACQRAGRCGVGVQAAAGIG